MTKDLPRWLKLTVDVGPLAIFFAAYILYDLMVATAAVIAASSLAVMLWLIVTRRLPVMPLVTALVIGILGGLTLWLNDERFLKMKPTIVQGTCSLILFGGLALKRPLLRFVMDQIWSMDQEGWHRLTLRVAFFFAAMAVLNEVVWRTQSTDFWVTYKVFGISGLTLLFFMAQAPLMQRHHVPEPDSGKTQQAKKGESNTKGL